MRQKIAYLAGLISMISFAVASLIHVIYRINHDTIEIETAFNVGFGVLGIIICIVLYNNCHHDVFSEFKSKALFMSLLFLNSLALFLSTSFFMMNGIKDYVVINSINNYLYRFVGTTMILLFWIYITRIYHIQGKVQKVLNYINFISFLLSMLAIMLNLVFKHYAYFDENGVYQRGSLHMLVYIDFFVLALSLITILFEDKTISYRKKIAIISYLVLPAICVIIQETNYHIAVIYGGTLISLVIVYCNIFAQRSLELEINHTQLEQQKLASIIAQVDPHFMYNALSSVYYLVDKEPEKAKAAINDFAKYLREGIESANKPLVISFEEELLHCKSYLKLEKLRYDDELNINYDIKETNFVVPRFSLQPIIENAVKHGISQNKNGGTVNIKTYKEEDYIVVSIEDDGPGFDTAILANSSRIGINNVKARIEKLVDGRLNMTSEPGKGTIVNLYFRHKE